MNSLKVKCMVCAWISVWALLIGATPTAAEETTVYVAGHPDLYPIEYYDENTEQYAGLMPELYAVLAQKTGYTFQYIEAGPTNGQARMAKNGQADIISAHWQGDVNETYLQSSQQIVTLLVDGKEKPVCIAFSTIASQEIITTVSKALQSISDGQKLALVTSHTKDHGMEQRHMLLLFWLIGVFVAAAVMGLTVALYIRKKRRANRENSMIDPRYGIGNDQYYLYCFDHLISDKSKSLYYLAYIAFDEDTFNQQYGDAESKSVQRYAAEFLNHKMGAVEYLALVSEGVFAVLYQSNNRAQAEKRIGDMMRALDAHLGGFKSEYTGLFRAGVCVLEENRDCNSEAAFYNAKQGYLYAVNHQLPVSFSSKTIVEETQQNERLYKRLTQAIRDGEFQMYLQYIVDRQGRIFGAEAVSRWHNPQEGLLSPGKYIAMMNQTGAVTLHDYYIFEKACGQLEKWQKSGGDDLCISCNFTRYSITAPDFVNRLMEVADRYSFRHDRLIIEITEDSLSHNPALLQENIRQCREQGFRFALDDIGSGYTSLSDLYAYPIDFVKVERDIVLNAMTPRGKMLLDGLVRLAHSMNMVVLCEGIETEEQNDMALSTGCDLIQGFYYSRVLPVKEADRYLLRHAR